MVFSASSRGSSCDGVDGLLAVCFERLFGTPMLPPSTQVLACTPPPPPPLSPWLPSPGSRPPNGPALAVCADSHKPLYISELYSRYSPRRQAKRK